MKSLFPFTVQKGHLYQAQVITQPNEHGTILLIYSGSKRMADFIATACNRQSLAKKEALSIGEHNA